jgi:hypothetical protein
MGGGEVKESTYKGFMETFDPATHHMNANVVRQRLEAGGVRDDAGRFRIRPGSSLLHPKARVRDVRRRPTAPQQRVERREEPELVGGRKLCCCFRSASPA